MLERYVNIKEIVHAIVDRHIADPVIISAREIRDVIDINEILRPLEGVTKKLSAQKYVTTNMVFPIVSILQKNIIDCEPKQQLGSQLIVQF